MKRFEGGSIFEGLHNGSRFSIRNFNSSHLNSRGFSLRPGQSHFIYLHHFSSPILLFILPSYQRDVQHAWGWDSDKVHGEEKERCFQCKSRAWRIYFFKPFTTVEVVNLKSLLRFPMATFRRMHTIFSNLGYVKLFPSEAKIRKLLNTSASYLREAKFSAKETLLQSSGTEK